MQVITIAGQPGVLMAIATLFGWEAWQHGQVGLVHDVIAIYVAIAANLVIKYCVRRTRPNTSYTNRMWIRTLSFPSGHAFSAAIILGFFAVLLLPTAVWASVLLLLSIALIGLSRLYLGAHYPTDVLGGWFLGFFGLVLTLWLFPL